MMNLVLKGYEIVLNPEIISNPTRRRTKTISLPNTSLLNWGQSVISQRNATPKWKSITSCTRFSVQKMSRQMMWLCFRLTTLLLFHEAKRSGSQQNIQNGVCMERHIWHLMLNIYKHTASYNMYCSYFFIRSILNIMSDCLNTLRCSFLITRSGFVIMRCRSYKWCSSLPITCCAFINCRASFYFMYSRYNIIRSIPLIIRWRCQTCEQLLPGRSMPK